MGEADGERSSSDAKFEEGSEREEGGGEIVEEGRVLSIYGESSSSTTIGLLNACWHLCVDDGLEELERGLDISAIERKRGYGQERIAVSLFESEW
jgi:hypothetical protein